MIKKFLVPVDFSETSKNAARFAAQIATGVKDVDLILYHVYARIAAGSDGSPLTEDDNDRRIVLGQALTNWKNEFQQESINIETVAEEGTDLVDAIEAYVHRNGVHLVILGMTGSTRMEQIFFGSNAVRLAKNANCPVIIVPPEAQFKKIKNVLFACDFKDVNESLPVAPVRMVLDIFQPRLHIVNVDSDQNLEQTKEFKAQRAILESILQQYNPEFYFIHKSNFEDAISKFALEKNIDLIMIIPKKHAFLSGLFQPSHTSKLAYHSHVPILAIHE
jgi:nucleotide-binding universal stress UspA family protein